MTNSIIHIHLTGRLYARYLTRRKVFADHGDSSVRYLSISQR